MKSITSTNNISPRAEFADDDDFSLYGGTLRPGVVALLKTDQPANGIGHDIVAILNGDVSIHLC
jgi:hypothetical protein